MQLPGPVRASIGLVASAADEAKRLPDRAIELPMLAVSTALQMSLRAQQRYARLAARGDAVLNRQQTSDDPPPWATFDDPVTSDDPVDPLSTSDEAPGAPVERVNGASTAQAAEDLVDEIFDADRGGSSASVARKTGKHVNAPRHTPPSRFDTVGDDNTDD